MECAVVVYADLAGSPVPVGSLWARSREGRESATFEYDSAWLQHPERFALEPALTLGPGPHHTASGRALSARSGILRPIAGAVH